MNRNIKFRAFCEQHNKWEVYTLGGLICGDTTSANGEGGPFIAETWNQFTGILDRTGKEIYEGDICDGHSDGYGIIVWTDFDGGYDYQFVKESDAVVGLWEVKSEIIVIGNIYENPELLK